MKNAIVCLSGGVESTTLLYKLRNDGRYKKILCLYVNYGHRSHREEKYCIEKNISSLGVDFFEVKLPYLKKISKSYLTRFIKIPSVCEKDLDDIKKAKERMKLWWVPSRNAIISTIALSVAESKLLYEGELYNIYIGLRRETPLPMPDNTPSFVKTANKFYEHSILRYHLKSKIKLFAPFINLTKEKIIIEGEKLKVPWNLTYSCYSGYGGKMNNGTPVHCGICSNCKRRKIAFKKAGIFDSAIYAS